MSVSHLLTIILLAIGVVAIGLSAIGILMVRDFYERLHYMGPAGSVGVVAIACALLIQDSFSSAGIKVILIALFLVVSNSILAHATARAGRLHQLGDWKPQRKEDIPFEKPEQSPSASENKKASHPSRRRESTE